MDVRCRGLLLMLTALLASCLARQGLITPDSSATDPTDPTDSTDPLSTLVLVTEPPTLLGGTPLTLEWLLTTPAATLNDIFTVEHFDGTTWQVLDEVPVADGELRAAPFSLVWQVPSITTAGNLVRVTYVNTAAQSVSATSAAFLIDSTPPVIDSLTLNGGVASSTTPVVPLALLAHDPDPGAGITSYMVSTTSTFDGLSWLSTPPATINLPRETGTYTVYAKAQDAVGLESAVASASVALVIASPPVVDFVTPLSTLTLSSAGAPVTVSWTASASAGLVADGMRVSYSLDDGATFTTWASALTWNGTSGGCTIFGDADGCATLSLPAEAAGIPFWIVLSAKDVLGQVGQAISIVMNGPEGLSLFAGRNSKALGGAAIATSLDLAGGIGRDASTGDIYLSSTCQLLKVSPVTGVIARWAGNPNTCDDSAEGVPLVSVTTDPPGNLIADREGNIYWQTFDRIWRYDAATRTAAVFVGGIVAPTSLADGTPRRSFDGSGMIDQFVLGADDRFYFSLEAYDNGYGNFHAVYRVEDDETVRHLAGTLPTSGPGPEPTEGASAVDSGVSSFAVIPGSGGTADRVFVAAQATSFEAGLWEVMADGTLHLIEADFGMQLLAYLPSRGVFAYHRTWTLIDNFHFYSPAQPSLALAPLPAQDSFISPCKKLVDDGSGGFYYVSDLARQVFHVDSANVTRLYAGVSPTGGNGGAATRAELRSVGLVSIDLAGQVYLYDGENGQVRVVDTAGIISSTFIGPPNGYFPYLTMSIGQGGPYFFRAPSSEAVDLGVKDINGVCVLFCGEWQTQPFVATASSSSDAKNLLADSSSAGGWIDALGAFDGSSNYYVHLTEYDPDNASYVRTSIKQISSGVFTEIAGNATGPFVDQNTSSAALKIADGMTVAGNYGGALAVGSSSFQAGAGLVFLLQSDSAEGYSWATPYSLYAGTPGGVWRREVDADVRNYLVDRGNSRIYYVVANGDGEPVLLYRKTIGVADDLLVADFGDVKNGVKPLAIDPTPTAHTLYLALGDYFTPTDLESDSVYLFIDSD